MMHIKNVYKKTGILFLVIAAVLLEISVFNFRHWESLFFPQVTNCIIDVGDGISIGENGLEITNTDTAYFDIYIQPVNVKNIWVDIESPAKSAIRVQVSADDAGNSTGLDLGSTLVVSSVPASRYLRLHLNGMSHWVRVKIAEAQGTTFHMSKPEINKERPFEFSWMRVSAVFLCLLFFYMFRPGSPIYRTGFRPDTAGKRTILVGYIGLHLALVWIVSGLILPDKSLQESIDNSWPAYGQYNELADALMKGQVYLDREPPQSLQWAENPYDGDQRWQAVVDMGGETFEYDYAYHDGKYYSYFGPIPALLFFIPYKVITGMQWDTWDMVTLCSMLFCIAGFWFVYVLCLRYFKDTSFGIYMLMSSFYVIGGGMLYLAYLGIVYSVPIITGLLFGTVGLSCWILARGDKTLSKKLLILGSVCVATVMGCRLQMAIILLFAFPIFWNEIVEERQFFSKKGLGNTMCVIVPFLIIGLGLMYYNYLRFQSPFDFGAAYNLTSNDMTHRGWVWDRIPLGFFEYLFQPLNVVPEFPFLKTVNTVNDYLGYTNVEFLFGGLFVMTPLSMASLLVFNCRSMLREYRVFGLTVSCFMAALTVIVADIQMAGLTQRYMSDFGWLILICSIMDVCASERKMQEKGMERVFYGTVLILHFISIVLNIWNLLITDRYFSLINVRPMLFFEIKHLLPFE